jgi:hypothetical protein
MKKLKLTLALVATMMSAIAFAQDSTKKDITLYTFIFNQVPENFKFPVIGLINVGEGNQQGTQIGFTNITQKNFNGAQVGFTNAIGAAGKGAQIGFVNATKDEFKGAQIGYVNAVGNKVNGAQIGFVNACKDSLHGVQIGHVNVAGKKVHGAQVGFVNVVNDSFKGAQIGHVNVARRTIYGTQIGFVNVADSIGSGVPIGFISVVRKGGYQAIEVGYSELYPVNVSFKIGVKKFYTSFIGSFNPDFKDQFAVGAVFGSMLPITKSLYFNPEAMSQVTFKKDPFHIVSLSPQLCYSVSDKWSVVAGPSVTWMNKSHKSTEEFNKPSFSLYENKIDAQNRIHVGAKVAVRFAF